MEQVSALLISKVTRDLFDRIVEYAAEEQYQKINGKIEISTMMLGGLNHGSRKKWIWEDYISKLEYVEEYFLGKLHGTCYYWDEGKLVKTVEYHNGLRHGKTQIFEDHIRNETYEKDVLVEFKEYTENGIILHMRRFPGMSNLATLFSDRTSSEKIDYEYFADTDTYKIIKYRRDRIRIHSTWYLKNGMYHGDYCAYRDNGGIERKCQYSEDKKHGLEQIFAEDGSIEFEATYRLGKLHGSYRKFIDLEEVETANYVNDLLHGVYHKIDDTTKLIYQYNMGKLHGLCIIYESDSIVKQFNMKNGVLHGPCMEIQCCYTINDNYFNGLLHGETVVTKANNKYVIQFQNGVAHGKYQIYKGKRLIINTEYNCGIRVGIKIGNQKYTSSDCRNCTFHRFVEHRGLID